MRYDAVRAVFTDLDGTLTTGGRLRATTYETVSALDAAGVEVVIVTGRPAGWGQAMFRLWPVRAVVTENGGVTFIRTPRGEIKRYGVRRATLPAVRRKMFAAAARVQRRVRGARLSADTPFTEVNLAVDWNEDVHLPEAQARRIEELLRAEGYNAVRSSVHVNFWPGRFDKLSACRAVIRAIGGDPGDLSPYLYLGDALNDEPMFAGFPRSIGVANVRRVWDELAAKPAHVTDGAEGAGFEEVARAVLAARARATRATP
jgi:HAD superfamily hydrolase (TIGR01484 family)